MVMLGSYVEHAMRVRTIAGDMFQSFLAMVSVPNRACPDLESECFDSPFCLIRTCGSLWFELFQ